MIDSAKRFVVYMVKYAMMGGLGVVCDFIIFNTLVYLFGARLAYSNIVSAVAGFVIASLVAGNTIFRGYQATKAKYAAWFLYLFAILLVLTEVLEKLAALGIEPFIGKIMITAVSFCCNGAAFRLIMGGKKIRRPGEDTDRRQETRFF